MDLEAIYRKVRALHRLANDRGATEHEAAAAASAMQKLIEQHRLDMSALDASESAAEREEAAERVGVQTDPLDEQKKGVTWRGLLAGSIARANGCKVFWDHGVRNNADGRLERVTRLCVIGTPSRASAVRYLYAWLSREVDRLGAEAARGRGRSYGNAFRVGCVERVGARLEAAARDGRREAEREARKAADGNSTALVRIDSRLARLEQEVDAVREVERNLGLRSAGSFRITNSGGYSAGRAAGDRVNLGSGPALGRGAAGAIRS